MRTLLLLLALFAPGFVQSQENIYCRYETADGMGIHIAKDDGHLKVVTNPVSEKYEFIEDFYLPGKPWLASKFYVIFRDHGKMGILSAKGEVIIPATYDSIRRLGRWVGEAMPMETDFFLFENDGQASIKHIKNLKDVLKETYDKILYDDYTGDFRCYSGDRVHFFCRTGVELFPEKYFTEVGPAFSPGFDSYEYSPPSALIAREKNMPMKVYSENGSFKNEQNAILHQFTVEWNDSKQQLLVLASVDGKMGLMDEKGNVRIPFRFDSLIPLSNRHFYSPVYRMITLKNNKEGLIDYYGKEIFPPEYLQGSFTENSTYYNREIFIVIKDTITQQGLFDVHGNQLIPVQTQTIREEVHNGRYTEHYFEVKRDDIYGVYTSVNKVGLYNAKGEEIIPCEFYSIHDENATDNKAKEPNFIKFNSHQEYHDYWENWSERHKR